MVEAIPNLALHRAMQDDPKSVVVGEDVAVTAGCSGDWWGCMSASCFRRVIGHAPGGNLDRRHPCVGMGAKVEAGCRDSVMGFIYAGREQLVPIAGAPA